MKPEALIPDLPTLKKYLTAATTAFTVDFLKPFLLEAYRTYLLPVVGEDQMEAFSAGNLDHTEALELIREALVNYAIFAGFDRLSVRFSANGVQQVSTDTSRPAPLETKANARLEFERAAHGALESLIGLLEEGAGSTFSVWKNSTAYKQLNRTLFHTSQQFNGAHSNTVARDGFLALIPTIARVETTLVRPLIPDTYDRLKGKIRSNTSLSELEETLLLEYLRPAIGLLATGKGLYSRAVVMNLEGTITQFDNTTANRQKGSKTASEGLVSKLYDTSIADGEEMLARMVDFVLKHAEDLGYEIPENPVEHPLETLNKASDRIYGF